MAPHRFMVVAFDPARRKVSYNPVVTADKDRAVRFVQKARPHCYIIDALSPDQLRDMADSLITIKEG